MTDKKSDPQSEQGQTRRSPEVGEGEEKRGSPPVMQALPPAPNSLHPPPGAITNRPPSVASTHSNASGAAPRTTATSRRGGRTRSRSPPTMINRPGSAGNTDFAESYDGRPQAHSPANPSSVAASAAAAAKALSKSSGGHTSAWFEGGDHPRDRRGDSSRYHHGYDNMFGGSRSWPGEDDSDRRRSFDRGSSREVEGEKYRREKHGDRGGEGYHRRRYESYGGNAYEGGGDYEGGRYSESRHRGGYERDGRGRASPSERTLRYRRENLDDFYKGPGGMTPLNDGSSGAYRHSDQFSPKRSMSRDRSSPATVKRSGGTRQVIGTPTPIHVPRAADLPASRPSHASDGTPASVFRRQVEDMSGGGGRRTSPNPDDSAQKILLSLRTPTTSFEDQRETSKSRKTRQSSGPPLSPEEPPQIQHAHHQQPMDQALFFEPQRGSPKQQASGAQGGTLEMAPSFSLFNQSFDSLGDTAQYLNVGGPLDGTFQSISFGAGPTGSVDNDNPQASRDSLGAGSFATGERTNSLLGTSSGGMLTFGMSPVNSFGNGAANSSSRRSNSMMVLGGPDQQSTSPTQMLSMYPSYSGGYGSQSSTAPPFRSRSGGQGGDNPMRSMSSGSFGGQSAYNKSYGAEGSPHPNYHGQITHEGSRSHDGAPNFYSFLGRHKGAFIQCSFLLPGLKAALLESPISDTKKSGDESDKQRGQKAGHARMGSYVDPSPHDIACAMRRVASAVCAFGGSISGDRVAAPPDAKSKDSAGGAQSIFRDKEDNQKAATVTPSSSSGTPPSNRGQQSGVKLKYDEVLPSRYYENENRLSWEFEESPPVENIGDGMEEGKNKSALGKEGDKAAKAKADGDGPRNLSSPAPPEKVSSGQAAGAKKGSSGSPASDQPKMRYRCKLCGQPKQNHICPYQQSLQRSIGIMVYPAVNAFTSTEPGMLAPALSDMNNFISSGSETTSSAENSPSRPTPDRARKPASTPKAPNVTPETMRSSNSPDASLGSGSPRTPFRSPSAKRNNKGSSSTPGSSSNKRKRPHSQMSSNDNEDLLFVETSELKPEQFRSVTPAKKGSMPDAYMYPALPLPYAQRKRLSDNLFSLSKEVPQLTDECAVVLREAREKDMWDLAVAELMTQVVVVIHCREGDSRFEGLRHYLLTLGIAC